MRVMTREQIEALSEVLLQYQRSKDDDNYEYNPIVYSVLSELLMHEYLQLIGKEDYKL